MRGSLKSLFNGDAQMEAILNFKASKYSLNNSLGLYAIFFVDLTHRAVSKTS